MGTTRRARRARAAIVVVACGATLAASGCWPAPGQGPDRRADNATETAISAATVGTLGPVWDVPTGTGSAGPPVVSGAGVHVRAGVVLHTLSTRDGATRWTLPADPTQPSWLDMSDPIVRDRQLVVGYGYGNLGGHWNAGLFDTATGAPAATSLPGGLVESVRGGSAARTTYAFGSGTPVLLGVGVTTFAGQGPNWSGAIDFRDFGTGGSAPAATLGTDGLYVSGRGIQGRDAQGMPTFGEGVRKFAPAPPSCDHPQFQIGLVCPAWSRSLDGAVVAPPVLGDGVLYVGTSAGTLYALATATGETRWSAAVGAAVQHPPAVARGHVYVPTADGDLVVLPAAGCGAATCTPRWSAATGSRVSAQPAVGGDVVVTGSADGSVQAFDADGCGAATCAPLWEGAAGSAVTGAPAIALGRLYVGTQDGHVIAYAPAPT